jgi:hypothetical protein
MRERRTERLRRLDEPARRRGPAEHRRIERRTLKPFTDEHPELDEAWGYAVQDIARQDSRAEATTSSEPSWD